MRRLRTTLITLVVLVLASTTAGCTIPTPAPAIPAPAVPAPASPPAATTDGMWLSPTEVRALPRSGAAWDEVRTAAHGDWGQVDLSDNNSHHDTSVLAGALVAVRTGDARLTARVRAALDEVATTTRFARVLEMSRNITSYVIAADLVGLSTADDARFRRFLSELRTKPLQGHSGGDSLVGTALRSPGNWGTMARAALVAIDLYLDDDGQLATVADAHRAYLGERVPNQLVYSTTTWHADRTRKVGINRRGAVLAGRSADGVIPEDQRRTGELTWPAPQGSYPWEALQGAMVTAVLLDRAGVVPFAAGDDALLRAFRWLSGPNANPADGDDLWQPWLMNSIRGASFATEPVRSPGKNMSWTDWTHAPGSRAAGSRMAGAAG